MTSTGIEVAAAAITSLVFLGVVDTNHGGDFTDQYDQFYPTLFYRDHRQYLISRVDHRLQYFCDCSQYYGRQVVRNNASQLQARIDVVSPAENTPLLQPTSVQNDTELNVITLEKHLDELNKLTSYDVRSSLSSSSSVTTDTSTSSFITQQQLLFVVLPCILLFLFIIVAICFIITSLARRQKRYLRETCTRRRRSNVSRSLSNGDGPSTGVQLCGAAQNQQQQQLYDTLSLGVLKLVPRSSDATDVAPSCSDRQKLTDEEAVIQPGYRPSNQWNPRLPVRKQVTVKCYLDTSAVHTVLIPKNTSSQQQ